MSQAHNALLLGRRGLAPPCRTSPKYQHQNTGTPRIVALRSEKANRPTHLKIEMRPNPAQQRLRRIFLWEHIPRFAIHLNSLPLLLRPLHRDLESRLWPPRFPLLPTCLRAPVICPIAPAPSLGARRSWALSRRLVATRPARLHLSPLRAPRLRRRV